MCSVLRSYNQDKVSGLIPEYNWATLFLGDLALQVGGVSIISLAGLGPENDYAGEG
jgi:hypothetical protein